MASRAATDIENGLKPRTKHAVPAYRRLEDIHRSAPVSYHHSAEGEARDGDLSSVIFHKG
jgi:hypothetical protein